MVGTFRRRLARTERGAAAVEAALVLTAVVLPVVFGIIAYGYMLSFRQTLSQAASEGARAAVGAPLTGNCSGQPSSWTATSCPADYAIAQAVQGALSSYGMSCVNPPAGSPSDTTGAAVTSKTQVQCTISVPVTTTTSTPNCSDGVHYCATVSVSYPYRSQNLLPTIPGLGFTLPSSLSFTTTVEVG